MKNPKLKNMDPRKQMLIKTAYERAAGRSGKELGNVMMALITGAKKQGIHFQPDEISSILSILKEGKTKEEQAEIEHMIDFARSVMKKSML